MTAFDDGAAPGSRATRETTDRRVSRRTPGLGPALLLALLAVVVALVVSLLRDVPLIQAVDDPAVTTDSHPLTGVLSALGILAWCTAAAVTLLTAYVLHRSGGDRTTQRFLLWGGVITTYLGIDDRFLIHDYMLTPTPVPQPAFLGLVVLAVAWYVRAFRQLIATTAWHALALAGVLFALSLGVDFVDDLGKYLDAWEASDVMVFVEDSLKWLGIVAWTTYFFRVCVDVLTGEHRGAAARDTLDASA